MREILSFKNCKKIALMGGTFDPIHYGHLVTAEAVRKEFEVERVLFIPTGCPPHKTTSKISHTEHRYLMTFLATVDNPYFDVSRIEIDREGLTYTIDTIMEIRALNKDIKIYFITGADAISQILTWKDAEKLLTLCSFIAVTRPGYNKKKVFADISEIKKKYKSRLHFLEVPALSISSTDIRNRVLNGQPIKYLLPDEVEKYIYKANLYTELLSDSPLPSLSFLEKYIKKSLSEKRYLHSMGVVSEAAKLALHYNVSPEKAQIAAVLHDIAKEYPSAQKRKLCKEYGIKLDEVLKEQLDLAHSFLAAEIATAQFQVKDEEILNAIRFHTTGRRCMSLLEKIIFIADYTEPNREPFEGLSEVREKAYVNLDEAVILSLRQRIDFNERKKRMVHSLSREALDYLLRKSEEI